MRSVLHWGLTEFLGRLFWPGDFLLALRNSQIAIRKLAEDSLSRDFFGGQIYLSKQNWSGNEALQNKIKE